MCSNTPTITATWKTIWQLHIPQRCACDEGLSTLKNLYQKSVVPNTTCGLCRVAAEDIIHALVLCPSIRNLWANRVPIVAQIKETICFRKFVLDLKVLISSQSLEIFFMISWNFWFRWNKWLHEQIMIHPSLAIEHALSISKQFKELQTIPNSLLRSHATWSPPSNYFKLIVDGSIFFNHNRVGIGWI